MSFPSSDTPEEPTPLIVRKESHPIRVEMLDKDAVFVLRKLNSAGFSSYLVGGGVRDLYLGKRPKDFDISTNARPGQIRKLFPRSETIGKRFRLVQVFFKGGKVIEVSTLRSQSEFDIDGPEAILAPNNTFGNLPDDAQRRDLSINSLFYELEGNTIIDYVGGVADLDNSIVRITGEPDKRILHDPVRMMRALRHSSRTGFTIEPQTWKAICANTEKLSFCPPSRIRDEFFKDLYGGSAEAWFHLALDSGLFTVLLPFYARKLSQKPQKNQPACRQQLNTAFHILDAIYKGHTKEGARFPLPRFFVLAVLVLPWAETLYQLSTLQLKGPDHSRLSRSLRNEVDTLLGTNFNLRKSVRQEIVTLLSSIPLFSHFAQNNPPPKWLRKKSYFANCLLFYQFHQALLTDNEEAFFEESDFETVISLKEHSARKGSNQQEARKIKPAFSTKKKGNIFGLRKHGRQK